MRKSGTLALLALCTLAFAAGCSSTAKDQALASDVKARMFSDSQVKSANVEVAVQSGEATLSGEVPSDAARLQAYKLAMETPGVKHVVDNMTVAQPVEQPVQPAALEAPPEPAPVRRNLAPRAEPKARPVVAERAPEPPPAPVAPPVQTAVAPIPTPPPPPQPRRVEIPAGTTVRVQMIDGVDSSVNRTGEMFRASLQAPVVVNNEVIVPSGADMYVKLVEAKSAGRMTGQSQLTLELVRMEFQGKSYDLVTSTVEETGTSRGKRTAATIGGGAAVGALIGAVIGNGKGAAIGAATGAGAGTAVQAATKGQQIQIPSESKLDFVLQQPVEVSYFPEKNSSTR